MKNLISINEFIEKCNIIHKNKYDYSKVKFTKISEKICIICPIHGEFFQLGNDHLVGHGCKLCGFKRPKEEILRKQNEFIIKAIEIHGDKYDYSLVEYKNCDTKVKIICKEHGIFEQSPYSHVKSKNGCPKCAGLNLNTEDFIKLCKKVHGNDYNYDLVNYIDCYHKVKIKCNTCNLIFDAIPSAHSRCKTGCPQCNKSKGEIEVGNWLRKRNINFIPQKTFKNCIGRTRPLPFDFYLPDYNICIEYDGIGHFEPVNFRGGMSEKEMYEEFLNGKRSDKTKNFFCLDNKIPLIRIPYYNVDKKLKNLEYLIKLNKFIVHSMDFILREFLKQKNIGNIYKWQIDFELKTRIEKNIRNENDKDWIESSLKFWKSGYKQFSESKNILKQINYFEQLNNTIDY